MMKTLGDTIRELRQAQNRGLRWTAGKLAISPSELSRIERGKEVPSEKLIRSIARLLACDPDVLLTLANSIDNKLERFLLRRPDVLELIQFLADNDFSEEQTAVLQKYVRTMKQTKDTKDHQKED